MWRRFSLSAAHAELGISHGFSGSSPPRASRGGGKFRHSAVPADRRPIALSRHCDSGCSNTDKLRRSSKISFALQQDAIEDLGRKMAAKSPATLTPAADHNLAERKPVPCKLASWLFAPRQPSGVGCPQNAELSASRVPSYAIQSVEATGSVQCFLCRYRICVRVNLIPLDR